MISRHQAPRQSLALVSAAAASALLVALSLQFVGGYQPCNLCVHERWPYLVVALAGLAGWWLGRPRPALALAALALAVNLGLSGYHVGVEQGWFALPETCAAVGTAVSVEELRSQLAAAPARCDQVSLSLLGWSLAAWNGVLAALLLLLALHGLARGRGGASAAEQHRQPGAA